MRRPALLPGLLAAAAFACLGFAAHPAAAADDGADYLYRTLPRDTLIGLGRRLLNAPRRWHDLQKYNAIGNPTRIPAGTLLRIPRDWLRQRSEAAEVVVIAGEASAGGAPVRAGAVLPEGARIVTAANGYVTLRLADGSVITLNPGSTLELARLHHYPPTGARDTELKLDSGSLETHVQPQGEAGRFLIRTPVAISAVRGTQFRRAVVGEGASDKTEVLGGAVAVAGAGAGAPAVAPGVAVATPATGVVVPAGFGTISDAASGPRAPARLLPPPDLSGLADRFEDEAVEVAWPAVSGARGYRAQIATDADFRSIVTEQLAGTPPLAFAALPDGHYFLRVRAVDAEGLEGADAVRAFERHRLPSAPAAQEPKPGAFVTGTAVTFRWDTVQDAGGYRFQLARDAAFGEPVAERERLERAQLRLEPLAPGRYYWRLATHDATGEAGRFGPAQSFTQKPLPPTLAEPVLSAGRSVAIRWPGEPGQRFILQLARDPSFSPVSAEQHVDVPRATFPKQWPGAWYVRVQAIDADGYAGPFSPARRFVVPWPWWAKAAPLLLVLPFL